MAAERVQTCAVPADQGAGGRVRGADQVDSGLFLLFIRSSLDLARVHVLHDKGLEERAPEAIEDGVRAGGRDEGLEFAWHGTWRITTIS